MVTRTCMYLVKESQPTVEESMFFNALNDLTEATQQYLEEEFGPDMASHLSSPLYYKQVRNTLTKKGKQKQKMMNQHHQSSISAKLICSF